MLSRFYVSIYYLICDYDVDLCRVNCNFTLARIRIDIFLATAILVNCHHVFLLFCSLLCHLHAIELLSDFSDTTVDLNNHLLHKVDYVTCVSYSDEKVSQ